MTETDGEEWTPSCYDCGATFATLANVARVSVHVDREDGGYDRIDVPMCRNCRKRRHGHDCPDCGQRYLLLEDAATCCSPAPREAPDCYRCGRRMERKSWGYGADGEPTVEWAECEDCELGWGRFTGWHQLDADTEDSP